MAVEGAEKGSGMVGFPYWRAIRRRFSPDNPFYASGNIERELLVKQVALDLSDDEKCRLVHEDASEVFCPIDGCGARLTSLEGFEEHYNARHAASCSVCSRVYPTSRLLSIHVSEAHDSFFQAKVARGYAMYECLVEGCGLKFKTYKARQQHLVDKHKFPASFDFLKKAHLSKKARQKHHRKQAAYSKEEAVGKMEVENETIDRKQAVCREEEAAGKMEVEDETINGLVSAVSKLTTSDSSPSSISFGRRRSRGLAFVPRAVQREKRPESSSTRTKS